MQSVEEIDEIIEELQKLKTEFKALGGKEKHEDVIKEAKERGFLVADLNVTNIKV